MLSAAANRCLAPSRSSFLEHTGDELTPAVRDEVLWRAKRRHGALEQPSHRAAARLRGESRAGQRKTREAVEYCGEVERVRAEQCLEFSHVHHPNMVDEIRGDRVRRPWWLRRQLCSGSDDLLSLDVAHRLLRDPEARQREV